jgi:hypothetical protein
VGARRYPDEFRERAVRLVVSSARPVAEVARELGLSARTLHAWVAHHRSFVPPEIRVRFAAVLESALPDPLPLDRTVNLMYEVAECLAEERSARGIHQVRAGHHDSYYLDCYREIQSPFLISVHQRIHQDGRVETLPSLETRRSSADPAEAAREAERVAQHNERVRRLLARKGFG